MRIIRTLLAALAALAIAMPAAAGDDPGCDLSFVDFPADGATDVPTNPIVFSVAHSSFDDGMCDSYDVTFNPPTIAPADGSGDAITTSAAVTVEEFGCCQLVIWAPDEDLAPATEYAIQWLDGETTFTTGDGADDTPPVITEAADDPCALSYAADEQVVLAVSRYADGIAHGVIITSPDGSLDGCTEYPWEVYDEAGNSVEVGGNAPPDDGGDDGGCSAAGVGRPVASLASLLMALLLG